MLNLHKKSNLVDRKLKKHFVNDVFNIQEITNLTKVLRILIFILQELQVANGGRLN